MDSPRVYRPSCFLRLRVRLEDFSAEGSEDAANDGKAPDDKVVAIDAKLKRLKAKRANLIGSAAKDGSTADTAAVDRDIRKAQRERAAAVSSEPTAKAQGKGAGDQYSVSLFSTPTTLTCDLNGARIADTVSATFPFADAPLISEIIRACVVEVWLGTISEEEFADPTHWMLSDKRAQIMFRGFVDSWDTNHSEGDATVQIQARSMESILIDSKINPMAKAYRISGSEEKISEYVNRILRLLPATAGNTGGDQLKAIWYHADPTKEPVLDRKLFMRSLQTAKSRSEAAGGTPSQDVAVADAPEANPDTGQAQGPAAGQVQMPNRAPSQEQSVWDLINTACKMAGCVPVYDPSLPRIDTLHMEDAGNYILLLPPQTLMTSPGREYQLKNGAIDQFQREFTVADGSPVTSDIRFLVWGHNIAAMKTSRKLGRVRVPGVEVTAMNPDGKPGSRRMTARYPKTSKIVSRIGSKGEGGTIEIKSFPVDGIRSQKQLEQAACSLYNSLCRQELSVNIETSDMTSYADPSTGIKYNEDLDMLRLRPGAPCRVTVARKVADPDRPGALVLSPLSEVFEQRDSQLVSMLVAQYKSLRPSRKFADVDPLEYAERIKRALQSAKLTDLFYCRTVQHQFSADDGWKCSIELTNYLSARAGDLSAEDLATQAYYDRATPKLSKADKATEAVRKSVSTLL